MTKQKLMDNAMRLAVLTQQIKTATEEADKIKEVLRNELPETGIEIPGLVCKVVSQNTPVFSNHKLYKQLTYEEIVVATKPVVTELRKIFNDSAQYEKILETCVETWNQTKCIKFYRKEA